MGSLRHKLFSLLDRGSDKEHERVQECKRRCFLKSGQNISGKADAAEGRKVFRVAVSPFHKILLAQNRVLQGRPRLKRKNPTNNLQLKCTKLIDSCVGDAKKVVVKYNLVIKRVWIVILWIAQLYLINFVTISDLRSRFKTNGKRSSSFWRKEIASKESVKKTKMRKLVITEWKFLGLCKC